MSDKKEEITEEGVKKTTENKTVGQASTISGGNKTTTTTTEPTIKRRQSTSWRYNPTTGETNTELVDSFNDDVNRYASANQIDTTTGKTDRKQLSSLLGFDPQVNKKRREEQEAIARRKQKEAALFNGLSVLGDMLTTAIGGNVEKRDAYEGGANAAKELEKLREEQAAEDTLIGTTINKNDNNYLDYINKLEKDYQKLFGVTQEISTPGSKTQTTSVGDKTINKTTTTTTDKTVEGDGSGSSSSSSKKLAINIPYAEGGVIKRKEIYVPKEQYKSIARFIQGRYDSLEPTKKNELQVALSMAGIKKQKNSKNYSADDLLKSGIIFNVPSVVEEFKRLIREDQKLSAEEKLELTRYLDIQEVNSEQETEETKSLIEKMREYFS
jgi:hypothetical protein